MDKSYANWDNRCKLCSGSYGRLNEEGSHNCCTEFKKLGLEIRNLGERCHDCNGAGFISYTKTPRMFIGNVLGPPCKACKGKGYTSEEEDETNSL